MRATRSPSESATDVVRDVARARAAQVALAWVHSLTERLGVSVMPIPCTERTTWLEQNTEALRIALTDDDLAALEGLAAQVVGERV